MVRCNFATHATCPLALTTYKYNELQVSDATQKLNYRPKSQNAPFSYSEGRFMSFIASFILARVPPPKVIKWWILLKELKISWSVKPFSYRLPLCKRLTLVQTQTFLNYILTTCLTCLMPTFHMSILIFQCILVHTKEPWLVVGIAFGSPSIIY